MEGLQRILNFRLFKLPALVGLTFIVAGGLLFWLLVGDIAITRLNQKTVYCTDLNRSALSIQALIPSWAEFSCSSKDDVHQLTVSFDEISLQITLAPIEIEQKRQVLSIEKVDKGLEKGVAIEELGQMARLNILLTMQAKKWEDYGHPPLFDAQYGITGGIKLPFDIEVTYLVG